MKRAAGDRQVLLRIAFWLLLPASVVQGLGLRKRAVRLQPPPGDSHGSCGEGESLHLLALGDSIIAGVGAGSQELTLPVQFARALAAALDCKVEWHIEGENGAAVNHLLAQVQQLDPVIPADVILLSIGVNDVTGLSTTRRWRRRLEELLALLRSTWPQAMVVFAGLPPMNQFPLLSHPLRFSLGLRSGTLDRMASALLAQQPGMLHIATRIDPQRHSFCADGFHPSELACQAWAVELADRTAKALPDWKRST
jgi:lysophospholipase L1-like esterase